MKGEEQVLPSTDGERIRLRAREETDLEFAYRWFNDWETTKYLGQRYARSRDFERKWLAKGDPAFGEASFIIETLDDVLPIGWCGLHGATPEDRCAGLGIAIGDHDYLQGGFGTDAMRTLCGYGFNVMNLHRIELTVFDWNERAIRCYERIGFQREGVLRDAIFKAGRWNDLIEMSLLKGELR